MYCIQLSGIQRKEDVDLLDQQAQRVGTPPLQRRAQRVRVVQPGEEKVPQRPYSGLSAFKRGL